MSKTPIVRKGRRFLIAASVVLVVVALVCQAARIPVGHAPQQLPSTLAGDLSMTVDRVNEWFDRRWTEAGLTPAEPADELHVLRRLSLALHGTIPSLEEIRAFERDSAPQRLERWTARMLADVRFADYFAERLARGFVGTEGGQVVVFRRDRFVDWLSEQLQENRPYNEIVRTMISSQGLWTGRPATNFITAAYANEDLNENKLAGRAVRAFLGQRIDCAQCHDHPFVPQWKQQHFEDLAAYFGQTELAIGVVDNPKLEYRIEDRETLEMRDVAPAVPFHPEWLPATGTRRERLAGWLTHPENRRFERAVANRVWGLMFGKPLIEPVDDLPDPGDPKQPDALDRLGADFREHGYDLRRLVHVIAASRPFRLASRHEAEDAELVAQLEREWAIFPVVRLRPEQVIGSMLQAASIKTVDQNSHLFFRFLRFVRSNDFVEQYGDLGENELDERAGTIPQALLRMNGRLSRELSQTNPINASGRTAAMASTDELCLEVCFLVCCTRRPTATERAHFLPQLKDAPNDSRRERVVEDIFWTLFNAPEFSWNH